jgi:hypothetical protein
MITYLDFAKSKIFLTKMDFNSEILIALIVSSFNFWEILLNINSLKELFSLLSLTLIKIFKVGIILL